MSAFPLDELHPAAEPAVTSPPTAEGVVLAYVDAPQTASAVVDQASQLAGRLRIGWIALVVGTPGRAVGPQLPGPLETARRVEELGGRAVALADPLSGDELVAYARRHRASHVVTAPRAAPGRWIRLRRAPGDALEQASGTCVHVLGPRPMAPLPEPDGPDLPARRTGKSALWPHLISAGLVVLATGVSELLDPFVPASSLDLVYLVAILYSAKWYGLWPGLTAVVLGINAYNYFFVPPRFSFTIDEPADVVALIFFTIAALVVSNLTALTQRQTARLAEHARTTDELYAFSRKISGIVTLEALLPVVAYHIAGLLYCNVVALLPKDARLRIQAAYPPEDGLGPSDWAAIDWTWSHRQPSGLGTGTLSGVRRLVLPLQTKSAMVGVVAVDRLDSKPLSPEERRMLEAVLYQTAGAIERIHLSENIERVHQVAENERLRNALLTSISHDFRTPLAGVIGALTSLSRLDQNYDAATRRELVAVALDDAERLDRFVGNLLDMTKLETGGIRLRLEPTDLAEVVGAALEHARSLLVSRRVAVRVGDDLPVVLADCILLERVIFNLVDNGAKHSPPGSAIEISARREFDMVAIHIVDEGTGIAPDALPALFDKFTRIKAEDRQRAGTGLGLAICRGFVEAMGGTIAAANRTDRSGAILTVRLPKAELPDLLDEAPEPHVS